MTYKQFVNTMPDDAAPMEVERRWRHYLEQNRPNEREAFYREHKDDPWIREKYDGELASEAVRRKEAETMERAVLFKHRLLTLDPTALSNWHCLAAPPGDSTAVAASAVASSESPAAKRARGGEDGGDGGEGGGEGEGKKAMDGEDDKTAGEAGSSTEGEGGKASNSTKPGMDMSLEDMSSTKGGRAAGGGGGGKRGRSDSAAGGGGRGRRGQQMVLSKTTLHVQGIPPLFSSAELRAWVNAADAATGDVGARVQVRYTHQMNNNPPCFTSIRIITDPVSHRYTGLLLSVTIQYFIYMFLPFCLVK